MKNRIRFNQVNLLENNGIYIKKSNDGKTAIIFPGHGSQYVNMLSDLRGRNKIVDETEIKMLYQMFREKKRLSEILQSIDK